MNGPDRSKCPEDPPEVPDTTVSPTIPGNALENSLASIAPNVAILHDSEGNPAVPK